MKSIIIILFLTIGIYSQTKPQPNHDFDRIIVKYDKDVESLAKKIYKYGWDKVYFVVKANEYVLFSADKKQFFKHEWNKLSVELKEILYRK